MGTEPGFSIHDLALRYVKGSVSLVLRGIRDFHFVIKTNSERRRIDFETKERVEVFTRKKPSFSLVISSFLISRAIRFYVPSLIRLDLMIILTVLFLLNQIVVTSK